MAQQTFDIQQTPRNTSLHLESFSGHLTNVSETFAHLIALLWSPSPPAETKWFFNLLDRPSCCVNHAQVTLPFGAELEYSELKLS